MLIARPYHSEKEDDLTNEDIVNQFSDSSFKDIMIREVVIERAVRHFAISGYPEQIYNELQKFFKEPRTTSCWTALAKLG